MEKLQRLLYSFFESTITELNFNVFENELLIQLTSENESHQIIFRGVSCLYFMNNDTNNRLNILEFNDGDYFELTSIYILDKLLMFDLLSEDSWVKSYRGYGNVSLEIWSKILIIETKNININGIDYNIQILD